MVTAPASGLLGERPLISSPALGGKAGGGSGGGSGSGGERGQRATSGTSATCSWSRAFAAGDGRAGGTMEGEREGAGGGVRVPACGGVGYSGGEAALMSPPRSAGRIDVAATNVVGGCCGCGRGDVGPGAATRAAGSRPEARRSGEGGTPATACREALCGLCAAAAAAAAARWATRWDFRVKAAWRGAWRRRDEGGPSVGSGGAAAGSAASRSLASSSEEEVEEGDDEEDEEEVEGEEGEEIGADDDAEAADPGGERSAGAGRGERTDEATVEEDEEEETDGLGERAAGLAAGLPGGVGRWGPRRGDCRAVTGGDARAGRGGDGRVERARGDWARPAPLAAGNEVEAGTGGEGGAAGDCTRGVVAVSIPVVLRLATGVVVARRCPSAGRGVRTADSPAPGWAGVRRTESGVRGAAAAEWARVRSVGVGAVAEATGRNSGIRISLWGSMGCVIEGLGLHVTRLSISKSLETRRSIPTPRNTAQRTVSTCSPCRATAAWRC